jgi:hypothetical protein
MERALVIPVDEGTPQGRPLSPLLRNIMLDAGVGAGLRFARYNGRTARGTAMGARVSPLQFSQRIGNHSGGWAQVEDSLKIPDSGKRHEGKSRSVSFAFGRSRQTPSRGIAGY